MWYRKHAQKLGQLAPEWQSIVQSTEFNSAAVYISQGKSHRALQDVEEDIALRFGKNRLKVLSQEPKILQFTGDLDMIKDHFSTDEQKGVREMDLGISSDELAAAKEAGFMSCWPKIMILMLTLLLVCWKKPM